MGMLAENHGGKGIVGKKDFHLRLTPLASESLEEAHQLTGKDRTLLICEAIILMTGMLKAEKESNATVVQDVATKDIPRDA